MPLAKIDQLGCDDYPNRLRWDKVSVYSIYSRLDGPCVEI
jgi:hypothetical protein